MLPLVQAGTLRVLAVTSRKRVGITADIPTVAEAGYPYLGLGADRSGQPRLSSGT